MTRVVAAVSYPDGRFHEIDLSHLWPFVPRIGDRIEWLHEDQHWEQRVGDVVINLDPAETNADVWVGGAGTASLFDEDALRGEP